MLNLSGLFADPTIASILVLVKSKTDRQKKLVKVNLVSDFKSSGITEYLFVFVCFGVDDKIDKEILVVKEVTTDGEIVLKKVEKEKEHYMTVTKELLLDVYDGEYLTKFYFLLGQLEKNQAQHLCKVLEEYEPLNALKVVFGDTNGS